VLAGRTYYWRVRTAAPLLSPWSETRSFTTGGAQAFKVLTPALGATGVDIKPIFSWSDFVGATGYGIEVSTDPTFATLTFSGNTTATFFNAPSNLAYSTTYYWRVKDVAGPYATGVFTTMATPATPQPPVVITQPATPPPPSVITVPVPQPAAIPTYLLWIIIGIGIVLVIALIILIVRTRRVG
jgi:hypothetical protein